MKICNPTRKYASVVLLLVLGWLLRFSNGLDFPAWNHPQRLVLLFLTSMVESFVIKGPLLCNENKNKEVPLLSSLFMEQEQSSSMGMDWSISDDWDARWDQENKPISTSDIFHQDIVGRAAFIMELQQLNLTDHDYYYSSSSSAKEVPEDETTEESSSTTLAKHIWQNLDHDKDFDQQQQQQQDDVAVLDENLMSHEIAQLIRCNQDPSRLLQELGRAIPPLTRQEQHHLRHLVHITDNDNKDNNNNSDMIKDSGSCCRPTPFFQDAVMTIFRQHAKSMPINNRIPETTNGGGHMDSSLLIMDRSSIASWLQRSSQSRCGPYDPRVTQIIGQFGKYGKGFLQWDDFQTLYWHALIGNTQTTPTTSNMTVLPAYYYNLLSLQRFSEIDHVWRDFEIHGIESPAQVHWRERVRLLEQELQSSLNDKMSSTQQQQQHDPSTVLYDECEILGDADDDYRNLVSTKVPGVLKKSSHERVELCSDNKTPLRFKDGDLVYIDEESCIGCGQCAMMAPSSFWMLDNGRARTFAQELSPAVTAAVAACPVNCMHQVGFDRLVELELARDHFQFPKMSRHDHHRHFGPKQQQQPPAWSTKSPSIPFPGNNNNNKKKNIVGQVEEEEELSIQWIAPTPLYVSRMESSDANHKESIYHFLRNQCSKSSACPQKGCFDCPRYANNPTENPHWAGQVKEAYHIRAQTFQERYPSLTQVYRKTTEL